MKIFGLAELIRVHFIGDRDTPICGTMKIQCYINAEDTFLEKSFNGDLSNAISRNSCDCL